MGTLSPLTMAKRVARHLRYRMRLKFQPRQNRVYSQFNRFPNQYRVLKEQVLPQYLASNVELRQRPLQVVVFACCNGEEVYTLRALLGRDFPELELQIHGVDIVADVVEAARAGEYSRQQVYSGPFVTEDFVQLLFDVDGDKFRVKPEHRRGVSFGVGDMTDRRFIDSLGQCDLLFAQNVLFHLPVHVAPGAFENLVSMTRVGGTLFINGMDTDMRIALTKKLGLEPVESLIEEIHEDARVDRGASWSNQYWGRAPFSKASKDWVRQFGTIFTKAS